MMFFKGSVFIFWVLLASFARADDLPPEMRLPEINFDGLDVTEETKPAKENVSQKKPADSKNVSQKPAGGVQNVSREAAQPAKQQDGTPADSINSIIERGFTIFEKARKQTELLLQDVKQNIAQEKAEPSVSQEQVMNALAKRFPDPLFYDAIYIKQSQFITYAYVYNNKSNLDNDHIPPLTEYNVKDDLFKFAKNPGDNKKFFEVVRAAKSSKQFDINMVDENGNTLLLTALRNANIEVFRSLLIDSYANPNICNNFQVCPIHLAVYANNPELVSMLCAADTNLMLPDRNGADVIRYSIFNRYDKVFGILIRKYVIGVKNVAERRDLIEFAKQHGTEEQVALMRRLFKM